MPRTGLRLEKLITITKYFSDFESYGKAAEVEAETVAWAQEFSLELPSYSHIRMSTDTHKLADYPTAVVISKIYHLLYFIDDKMANDTRRSLSTDEAAELKPEELLQSCFLFIETGKLPENPPALLLALADLLHDLLQVADQRWLIGFMTELEKHLRIATQNLDTSVVGKIWSLEEYIKTRRLVSGMNVMIWLTKLEATSRLGQHAYVTPEQMKKYGFGHIIDELESTVEDYGGLANDVISVEKELRRGTDFNLVLLLMLSPQFSDNFPAAIQEASHIVNTKFNRSLVIVEKFRRMITHPQLHVGTETNPEFQQVYDYLVTYVPALLNCMIATWYYQTLSERYKSPTSPYRENRTNL